MLLRRRLTLLRLMSLCRSLALLRLLPLLCRRLALLDLPLLCRRLALLDLPLLCRSPTLLGLLLFGSSLTLQLRLLLASSHLPLRRLPLLSRRRLSACNRRVLAGRGSLALGGCPLLRALGDGGTVPCSDLDLAMLARSGFTGDSCVGFGPLTLL